MKNSKTMYKIHELSDVQTSLIGEGTVIWQYAIVLERARIGKNCNINCHTFIENDVIIGNNVTIKSGVYLWDGIRIDDDVFVGPGVVFTNDLRPRSKKHSAFPRTTVYKGASIGANSTILAGVTIGPYAMTGIGSNVTKDVPSHSLVYGNPAIRKGWVDEQGDKMSQVDDIRWRSNEGNFYLEVDGELKREL